MSSENRYSRMITRIVECCKGSFDAWVLGNRYSSWPKVIVTFATEEDMTTATSTMSPPHGRPGKCRYRKRKIRKEWPLSTHYRSIGMKEEGLRFAEISRRVQIPRTILLSA